MATKKIKMMMLVNLKACTTPQLLSTTSHHSPLPIFINMLRYCPSNKRQIITCSCPKVPRFGIANAMVSKEIMLLSTAQQPYTTTPFRSTADNQISFEPSCDHLLVVDENIIEHGVHMFDTAFQEYLGKLEEKRLSKENVFSPLLCTIKQLFTNMDKVVVLSELLLLAEKSSITLNLRKMQIIQLCNKRIAAESMQPKYWEAFPETPKEIFKAIRELILVDDNPRASASLTDASTNKLIEDTNALTMIRQRIGRIVKKVLHGRVEKTHQTPIMHESYQGIGPDAEWNYTFYYGSYNKEWIEEFVKKATVVINDPCIQKKKIHIELCYVGDLEETSEKAQVLSHLIKISGKKEVLQHFESGSDGRFVLTARTGNQIKNLLLDEGGKRILKVLEDFHKWKKNALNDGFEEGFVDYYKKFTRYDD